MSTQERVRVATYLRPADAAAVEKLAKTTDRSLAAVVRDLIRSGLAVAPAPIGEVGR